MVNVKVLVNSILYDLDKVNTVDELNFFKSKYFGKDGFIINKLKYIKYVDNIYRVFYSVVFNEFKRLLILNIKNKENFFNNVNNLKNMDYTLPSRGYTLGSLHPITLTIRKIEDFFGKIGFNIVFGPEIEDEYHNFDALNISYNHPARDMHDTFYFFDNLLLRTHTSSVQIREMLNSKPPFKLISFGKVYRRDFDNTHTPMFHQVEGLIVDKDITFLYLKNLINEFINNFFQKNLVTRFRSSYFPFTEPSLEVDIECFMCFGKGCKVCSESGWIEVLGCGMVNPIVLANCNIDHEIYSGLAFGIGIDRLSMLFYNIDDLRLFFDNNIAFLKQF